MFSYFRQRILALVVILLAFVFMISTPAHTNAQGGVGSTRGLPDSAAGIHSIAGRVYLPTGQRAGPGVLVKLEGNVNGTRTAATDGDGAFAFNGLPAADYQIILGRDERGNETMEILVETAVPLSPEQQARIRRELYDYAGLSVAPQFIRAGELPRAPGKAIRVIDKRH